MEKLCLHFNYINDKSIEEYLNSLNGIKNACVDVDNEEINIFYDKNIISSKIILLEIYAYSNYQSSLVSFVKEGISKVSTYNIIMNDNCEFCYMSLIDDLYNTEGVISVSYDFDNIYNRDEKPNILVTYDSRIVNIKEINRIAEKYY